MWKIDRPFILCYVFFFIGIVYIAIALFPFSTFTLHESPYAYFNYLIDAFFHGRLNIMPSSYTGDLSLYQGKWYLNWGPGPVLFILPFYLIWGVHMSDRLYTVFGGLVNVVLFYFVIVQFIRYFKLKAPFAAKIFILLNFAFCSPNFFLASIGRVWNTEQIVATTYILICYLCYLLFLNKNKLYFLLLSVVFLNLAWISRYTLIFSGVLFLYPFFLIWKKKNSLFLKAVVSSMLITTCFFMMIFSYNYIRFGDPLETGIHYHLSAPRYAAIVAERKLFSPGYIPHNLYYFFISPLEFSPQKPFLKINTEGNSIFAVYPLLILLFLFIRKSYWQGKKRILFLLFSSTAMLCTVIVLLCYFATGWVQFGNRYFQDIIPLAFLLTLFVIDDIPFWLQLLFFFYGFIINILGLLALSSSV